MPRQPESCGTAPEPQLRSRGQWSAGCLLRTQAAPAEALPTQTVALGRHVPEAMQATSRRNPHRPPHAAAAAAAQPGSPIQPAGRPRGAWCWSPPHRPRLQLAPPLPRLWGRTPAPWLQAAPSPARGGLSRGSGGTGHLRAAGGRSGLGWPPCAPCRPWEGRAGPAGPRPPWWSPLAHGGACPAPCSLGAWRPGRALRGGAPRPASANSVSLLPAPTASPRRSSFRSWGW